MDHAKCIGHFWLFPDHSHPHAFCFLHCGPTVMDDTDKCERFKIYSFWGQNRQASEVNGTKLAGGFYKNMSTDQATKN